MKMRCWSAKSTVGVSPPTPRCYTWRVLFDDRPQRLRRNKDRLRNHPVHALLTIHQLRNRKVRRHAGKHVSVIPRETFFSNQEVDHLPHGLLGGQHQLFVHPHHDEVRRRLRARPFDVQVFAHNKPKPSRSARSPSR